MRSQVCKVGNKMLTLETCEKRQDSRLLVLWPMRQNNFGVRLHASGRRRRTIGGQMNWVREIVDLDHMPMTEDLSDVYWWRRVL
jgi:hypothetical protein